MSGVRGVTIVLVPILVLGTMAVGLRLGAEPPGLAAHVIPMPAPAARDRLVWQVRVFREERRIREPGAGVPIVVIATSAKSPVASVQATTNEDGIAEVTLPLATKPDEEIDVEVRGAGVVLARGRARVPASTPSQMPAPVRATKADGDVKLEVFSPPGGIAPSLLSTIKIRARPPSAVPAHALTIKPEGEAGLEIAGSADLCGRDATLDRETGRYSLSVRAMGHVLGLRLDARAENAHGAWYGALPVVPGGDEIAVEPLNPAADAPFALKVTSPTSKPMVYVEIYDDAGRELAAPLPLTVQGGYRVATMPVRGLPKGRHFAIASSRAEGFDVGTAVARGFLVGERGEVTCEGELDLFAREPPRSKREVAIDGFDLRRAEAARIRRKGMTLAVASLTIGAILAAVTLLAPLRKKPTTTADGGVIEGLTKAAMPRWAIAAMLLGLSCLAYLLLAGLVLYSGN